MKEEVQLLVFFCAQNFYFLGHRARTSSSSTTRSTELIVDAWGEVN